MDRSTERLAQCNPKRQRGLPRLSPSEPGAGQVSGCGEKFGYAVAVDGDTAVVGAPEDEGVQLEAGAVYCYVESGHEPRFFGNGPYFRPKGHAVLVAALKHKHVEDPFRP